MGISRTPNHVARLESIDMERSPMERRRASDTMMKLHNAEKIRLLFKGSSAVSASFEKRPDIISAYCTWVKKGNKNPATNKTISSNEDLIKTVVGKGLFIFYLFPLNFLNVSVLFCTISP